MARCRAPRAGIVRRGSTTTPRWVTGVPPDPFLRFDTCSYSLDPRLVGRRVEVRVGERELAAVATDSGGTGCRHVRSFAGHRTVLDINDARAPRFCREAAEPVVEVRPLVRYDALTV